MGLCSRCKTNPSRDNHRYCKPCGNANSRAWYYANIDRARESSKKWKKENPNWRGVRVKGDPMLRRMRAVKRRAQKFGTYRDLSRADKSKVKELYRIARELGWHVDHIVPLSKGGLHHPDNLQIIKPEENLSKGTDSNFKPSVSVTIK